MSFEETDKTHVTMCSTLVGHIGIFLCVPVSDIVSTAVDITSAIEARCFTIKWYLTDAASKTAHVPRTMKASHFEQMTLFNRLLATEANVAIDVG